MGSPLTAWHADHGAVLATIDGAQVPLRYADADAEVSAARSGAGLLDLSHLPAITITSPDAKRWCNGMFTNNIRKLTPGTGNRSAMCDDRGRVQGLIDLYCTSDEGFFGVLDGVALDWFEKRYGMYMMLDDIELESCADTFVVLSLQGPRADEILLAMAMSAPEGDHAHLTAAHDGATIRIARKDRTGLGGGVDLFVPIEVAASLWSALIAAGATAIGHEALDALRILGGRARWPQDGSAKSMVHELGINEEVCAFDKGCYVGQEVINRIDVKGLIQKRLTGFCIDGEAQLGAQVSIGKRSMGKITSVATVNGTRVGLAVLRKDAWAAGTSLSVHSEDGEPFSATVGDFPLL